MKDAPARLADALRVSTARMVLVPRAALVELLAGTTDGVRLTLSDEDVTALAVAAWNTSPERLDEFGPWGYSDDHPDQEKATIDAARRTIERLLSGKDDHCGHHHVG